MRKVNIFVSADQGHEKISVTVSRIFLMFGLRFAVWQRDEYHLWEVVEISSGCKVSGIDGTTINTATKEAKEILQKIGEEKTTAAVAVAIEKYGRAN